MICGIVYNLLLVCDDLEGFKHILIINEFLGFMLLLIYCPVQHNYYYYHNTAV